MNDQEQYLTPKACIDQLSTSLIRLEQALLAPASNSLRVDASIQRFKIAFDHLWRALQVVLLECEGIEVSSPRQSLKKAYALGWIEGEVSWLTMMKDCNLTSHTYKEALAEEIFGRLQYHLLELSALSQKFREKIRLG